MQADAESGQPMLIEAASAPPDVQQTVASLVSQVPLDLLHVKLQGEAIEAFNAI